MRSRWCQNDEYDDERHGWCANRTPDEARCDCPCHAIRQEKRDRAELARLLRRYPEADGDADWRHRWHARLGRGETETEGRFYERLETRRLGAATLAQEVLASKQNVGRYLRGLAEAVLQEAHP